MSSGLIQNTFLFFIFLSAVIQLTLSIRQSRVVLAHIKQVPVIFKDKITLEEHTKSSYYTLAKQRVARYEIIFQVILLLIFTLGGGINWLAGIANIWFPHLSLLSSIALILLFFITNYILELPFIIYRTFILESHFEFNKMTIKIFILDQIKSMILLIILGVPLLALVLYLMGKMGQYWWLYVWLVWVVFSLGMMWAYPRWIAPIFNHFTPLDKEELVNRIMNLLKRTGFKSNGIFVMDGSKRSGHGNAYFTGLGQNKRIVFFDTLLDKLNDEEVEAVLAHELGHFYHKHIIKQLSLSMIFILIILFILGKLMLLPAFYTGLGVNTASYAVALLLFMMILPVFLFPLTPLSHYFSRKNEFEADKFATKVCRIQDLISALTKLYADNSASLVCDKYFSLFYDTHPSPIIRITTLQRAIK